MITMYHNDVGKNVLIVASPVIVHFVCFYNDLIVPRVKPSERATLRRRRRLRHATVLHNKYL